jgi:hypothetical protein
MKAFFQTVIALTFSTSLLAQSPLVNQPVVGKNKVQIAILFDTSSSMDGLIEQAKSVIWQIVNAASKLKMNGESPRLEISLYDYGNDGITTGDFVRQQFDLISDLDSISEKLFALRTNGGEEYCATVIKKSLTDLKWSTVPEDVKLIYIAGNEPFNQGKDDYKKILFDAANSGVVVNTIYCGPYDQGVREFWYDGAMLAQGNYFNIDSNKEIQQISTPYDSIINTQNAQMNSTYMSYGFSGKMKGSKQLEEDKKASSKGQGAMAERAISKSNYNYSNSSWDLVDAYKADSTVILKLKEEELPEEMRNKSAEEKTKMVNDKLAEREKYQSEINELAKKREEFIAQEMAKRALDKGEEDLGTSIIKSMNVTASKKGYTTE